MFKGVLLACIALALLAACGESSAYGLRPHPSDEQARAFLSRIVVMAEAKDFAALCSHGSLNCSRNLDDLRADATVPSSPPLIVGSRDVPDRERYQGGRLLEVCGLDGAGKAYRSSLLFFGTDDQFTVIEALYWTPMSFAEVGPSGAITESSSTSTGPEWAGCPLGG